MKPFLFTTTLLLVSPLALPAQDAATRRANTIVLDETGVKNLRIETGVIEPGDFEEITFALGRIEVYPGNRAVVSSRIAGRALEVRLKLDHAVTKGEIAAIVESRQPGNPPPSVELTAPLSGLVSAVDIVTGEPVDPDKPLAEILDLTEVYALARVPETFAASLKPGQRAHITVAAASGETFPAELEHLGATADPASGTVEAAFHVANSALKLRPGMRAEFSIITSKRSGVTSVPRSALQGSPANRFVYVKDFDLPNAFVKTPVVIGESNDRSVEVVGGLLPGDEVVIQGAYSLAFAGGGTLSLKEALDAAHGHEHAADGSELKPGAATGEDHDHDHDDHDDHGGDELWKILAGVFFVAFVVTLFAKTNKPAAPRANS
jgi:membrane fusion protein, heavy metal efflux system